MSTKSNVNISKKTFISAIIILMALLMISGILTQIVPTGSYIRTEVKGDQIIIPDSFSFTSGERLPVLKWFTAPIEVLFSGEGVIIITIILFLLIIGGAIHILNEASILKSIIDSVVIKFKNRKYLLLAVIVFIFMSLGAFIGIFEEIIPLIPLMIALSLELKWDKLTGLGMSLLATGFGFSAAVSNPFTIGVAQEIAGIQMFSGAPYRIIIFIVTYFILTTFLIKHAKKIECTTNVGETISIETSKIVGQDKRNSTSWQKFLTNQKGVKWFLVCTLLMVILILLSPVVPIISQLNLPIIGLVFLVSGIGGGILSGFSLRRTLNLFLRGARSMTPGIVLILLATGVKHVIQTGGIMDTLLFYSSEWVSSSTSLQALLLVYLIVFIMNFFIGSGSAKAFIIIPIIAPLMEMMGITKQMAILAFQFGDGFSNILYPTNAVLLIALGLADLSYVKWLKWVFKIQLIMGVISIAFLWIGLIIGY